MGAQTRIYNTHVTAVPACFLGHIVVHPCINSSKYNYLLYYVSLHLRTLINEKLHEVCTERIKSILE